MTMEQTTRKDPRGLAYVEERKITELFQAMLSGLLFYRPDDHISFLLQSLADIEKAEPERFFLTLNPDLLTPRPSEGQDLLTQRPSEGQDLLTQRPPPTPITERSFIPPPTPQGRFVRLPRLQKPKVLKKQDHHFNRVPVQINLRKRQGSSVSALTQNKGKGKSLTSQTQKSCDQQLPVVLKTTRLAPIRSKEEVKLPFRNRKTQDGSTKPMGPPAKETPNEKRETPNEKREGKIGEPMENRTSDPLKIEGVGIKNVGVKNCKPAEKVRYITDTALTVKGTGMDIKKQKKNKKKSTKSIEMDFLDRQNWPSIEESFELENISKRKQKSVISSKSKSTTGKVVWWPNKDLELGFKYKLKRIRYVADPKYKQNFVQPTQKQAGLKRKYKDKESYSELEDIMLGTFRKVKSYRTRIASEDDILEKDVIIKNEESRYNGLFSLLAMKNRLMREMHYDMIPVHRLKLQKNFGRRRRHGLALKKAHRKRELKKCKRYNPIFLFHTHEYTYATQRMRGPKVSRVCALKGKSYHKDKFNRLQLRSFRKMMSIRSIESRPPMNTPVTHAAKKGSPVGAANIQKNTM